MGRLRGCLWLTAGLVVALLAALVGYLSLTKAITARTGESEVASPKVTVVITTHAVSVRSALSAADLQLKEIPVEAVPEGALRDVSAAQGKVTLVDLYQGEVLVTQRLLDPNVTTADGRQALIVANDQVLMAVPADDLLTKVGVLKPGDHVDLLFSLDFPANGGSTGQATNSSASATGEDKQKVTFNLLQNVTIAGVIGGPQPKGSGVGGTISSATSGTEAQAPKALLITINPQDALVLKQMRDAGGILDLVLRAPNAEQPFTTEPVDTDYIIKRYRIPVGAGR